eukprot:Awhi_evm1s5805
MLTMTNSGSSSSFNNVNSNLRLLDSEEGFKMLDIMLGDKPKQLQVHQISDSFGYNNINLPLSPSPVSSLLHRFVQDQDNNDHLNSSSFSTSQRIKTLNFKTSIASNVANLLAATGSTTNNNKEDQINDLYEQYDVFPLPCTFLGYDKEYDNQSPNSCNHLEHIDEMNLEKSVTRIIDNDNSNEVPPNFVNNTFNDAVFSVPINPKCEKSSSFGYSSELDPKSSFRSENYSQSPELYNQRVTKSTRSLNVENVENFIPLQAR